MPDVEDAIFSRLSGFAGLAALIGTRIHPDTLPQEEPLPAIVYQRISTVHHHTHDGPSKLAAPRFQLTVWAETSKAARAVARQIFLALEGFKGTVSGVRIDAGLIDNELTDRDPETEEFRRIVEVFIWHDE